MEFLLMLRRRGITDQAVLRAMEEPLRARRREEHRCLDGPPQDRRALAAAGFDRRGTRHALSSDRRKARARHGRKSGGAFSQRVVG